MDSGIVDEYYLIKETDLDELGESIIYWSNEGFVLYGNPYSLVEPLDHDIDDMNTLNKTKTVHYQAMVKYKPRKY